MSTTGRTKLFQLLPSALLAAFIVLAIAWTFRDVLFPTPAVLRLVRMYNAVEAQPLPSYAHSIQLESVVTDRYLRSTMGSPPYWPKWERMSRSKGLLCIHSSRAIVTGRRAVIRGYAHYKLQPPQSSHWFKYEAVAVREGLHWKLDAWTERPEHGTAPLDAK